MTEAFQKLLFGAVLWLVLGVGLLGLGIFGAIKFDDWTQKTALLLGVGGSLVLVGTFSDITKLFEECFGWSK